MANAPKALGALSLTPTAPYSKPKVKQDRPAYGVINNGFYDHKDRFRQPGSMLYYDGEPNQNLYPLNKKTYVRQPRQEWAEDGEVEIPQIEHVMGVPKPDDGKDEIR